MVLNKNTNNNKKKVLKSKNVEDVVALSTQCNDSEDIVPKLKVTELVVQCEPQ